MEQDQIHQTLRSLLDGHPLDDSSAEQTFLALLNGQLDQAQTGALLALIQTIPPNAQTLTGAARAMRAHVEKVEYTCQPGEVLIDTCGTGGAPKSFNVSTAAAIVAASVQLPTDAPINKIIVAKHGNRSRTGRGSAEVLETHKSLKGAEKSEYLKTYFPRTWAHFDVNKAGDIGVEVMPQFIRFLTSDQTVNLQ